MINAMFYAWKRSVPGREHLSARHFDEFVGYLSGLQDAGQIQSFDTVLLDPNGSGVNGFFLIKGEDAKLAQVLDSPEWSDHIVRSLMHLEDPMLCYGVSGELGRDRLQKWVACIPAREGSGQGG